MIKVLHILPRIGPAGAEMMAANLMRTLDRDQFEVSAISLYNPSGTELEGILARDGVPVWYLGKRPGFDPLMFVRLAQTLERVHPDVVHTHLRVLRYALPYMLCRQIPSMIHTVHNLSDREVDWAGRLVHRIAFKRGVLPVAIAEEVADSLRRHYGIDGFPLIPNGIPVAGFRRPPADRDTWRRKEGFAAKDVLFTCVAGLRPQKNPRLLLKAFARGPATDARAHLLIVGEGPLRSDLEREIIALDLQGKVHLVGLRSDIPEILSATDVFVLSSDWEGNPLSVMEAMAAGKPVICTDVGGVPELVVDGKCGMLVPRRGVQALADAMRFMLENPEARSSMGNASAARAVEQFDLSSMTEAYEKLYRATITKARSALDGRKS